MAEQFDSLSRIIPVIRGPDNRVLIVMEKPSLSLPKDVGLSPSQVSRLRCVPSEGEEEVLN